MPQDYNSDSDVLEEEDIADNLQSCRKPCHVCRRDTCTYFCHGCRCWLCAIPAKPRKVKIVENKGLRKSKRKHSKPKKKYKSITHPYHYSVDVPVIDDNNKPILDSGGLPKYQREYGEYTCYMIAHQKQWKNHLLEIQTGTIIRLQDATKKHS